MKSGLLKLFKLTATVKNLEKKWSRDALLKNMPKASICAEIGVDRGDFAARILKVVRPKELHLIDPWKFEGGEQYKTAIYGGAAGGQAAMDRNYEGVLHRFRSEIEKRQVIVHRGSSADVCDHFEDGFFDWIYIDGNHLYEFAKKDLELYRPKIKKSGVISGDDYAEGGWWQGGVKKAVDEFVAEGQAEFVQTRDRQYILRPVPTGE
jgi:hypothetical protein